MPDLVKFMRENNRVPMIGDSVPPWEYRGWLLWYVQLANELHPAIPDRWGYLARTIQSGKLLKEPIPEIGFGEAHSIALGQLRNIIQISAQDVGYGWIALTRVVDWLSFGLGESENEPKLSSKTQEEMYRKFDVKSLLIYPCDYLGMLTSENIGSGRWNPNAFYPTPHNVVECIIQLNMRGSGDMRAKSVLDPCVGTGRMLLHASNYSMRLSGQDIDPLMVAITKVNGALYAPWMVRKIPFLEDNGYKKTNIPKTSIAKSRLLKLANMGI